MMTAVILRVFNLSRA